MEALRQATQLLPANATAWNYLGVAYQKNQQPDEAAAAYQRALTLDRDLVEAHWNLGMLWLEQSKNDQAVSEFTAYTLRRSNTPEGWLKLGAAQLRLGQVRPAFTSFSWVLKLNPNNAEAMNGMGLACLEGNDPQTAVKWFAADAQSNPGSAAPTLNLAVTAQQYLHDDRLALQYYHAYLDLSPRPENWEDVSEIANGLERGMVMAQTQPLQPPVVNPTPVVTQTQPQTPPAEVRHPLGSRPVQPQRPSVTPVVRANPSPITTHSAPPVVVAKNQPVAPAPVIQVPPEPKVATATNPPAAPPTAPPTEAATDATPPAKASFWDKIKPTHWFAPTDVDKKYENSGMTSLPSDSSASSASVVATPAAPPAFPRYGYHAPARPAPGDRRAASGACTRAQVFEQGSQWVDAAQAYHAAAEFDPSWFQAQYNYGVLSYRLGNQQQALAAYEMALAIQPDSVDARYNLALSLKAAGYVTDAINELKKVLAANPDEVRAHLALANLYAQKLHDTEKARDHYLKVLDLDPGNAEASDIRYWLSINSQ